MWGVLTLATRLCSTELSCTFWAAFLRACCAANCRHRCAHRYTTSCHEHSTHTHTHAHTLDTHLEILLSYTTRFLTLCYSSCRCTCLERCHLLIHCCSLSSLARRTRICQCYLVLRSYCKCCCLGLCTLPCCRHTRVTCSQHSILVSVGCRTNLTETMVTNSPHYCVHATLTSVSVLVVRQPWLPSLRHRGLQLSLGLMATSHRARTDLFQHHPTLIHTAVNKVDSLPRLSSESRLPGNTVPCAYTALAFPLRRWWLEGVAIAASACPNKTTCFVLVSQLCLRSFQRTHQHQSKRSKRCQFVYESIQIAT